MPRNGSGTYTIPNTFVAGSTAVAADVNENNTDIASALTGSLPVNGEAPMTGQLPAASGTLSAPGIAFNGDLNTGLYRSGADTFVLVCGGVAIATLSTSGLAINVALTADSSISTAIKTTGLGSVPVGAVFDFAGSSAPTGYLLCYGQAISRSTYSALFTAIGTTHGGGDGSTTFNLPDYRGRLRFGKDDMGGSSAGRLTGGSTLGATVGAQTVTIAQANLPNVSLSSGSLGVSITPNNTVTIYPNSNVISPAGGTSVPVVSGSASVSFSGSISGSVPLGGSGTALSVVNPGGITNVIIYTGVA